ncbi:transglutaminase-like domain-containing protein [Maribacter dokdonensis]|uniref:transglutaminase-like domain-containing protein n=1 Tax=Maribacter dokdonensis TaxID=320912 RepID=UPI002AB2D934|nr:transglutaminase family protein [Maribacter dokdonensis]
MPRDIEITYRAKNIYDDWVHTAYWQFLIIPVENDSQHNVEIEFNNSLFAITENSINGYGFKTLRIHPKKKFKKVTFEAKFKLIKEDIDPFDFNINPNVSAAHAELQKLDFRINYERFLKATTFTNLSFAQEQLYAFDSTISIFKNLENLNHWVYNFIEFSTGATDVSTMLNDVVTNKKGVCQDFAHLFCALARINGIPTRYVSGYLDQTHGFKGDSQMHAWVECYIPEMGWKGFDPTNNILADMNHLKVCHGKDYNDCAPLKGIIYSLGTNKTTHSVTLQSQQ